MKEYLRKPPSDTLIDKACKSLGLESFSDTKWVRADDVNHELMLEVIAEMSELYFPCWYNTYIAKDPFTYKDYVIICRQLFRYKKFILVSKSTNITLKKNTYKCITLYSLKNPLPSPTPKQEVFAVSFD